jgi:hypothetical protein
MRWKLLSLTMFCLLAISTTAFAAKLKITTASLANGTAGGGFSATIEATGGTAPYAWMAKNLPPGVSLNDDGSFSGSPNYNTEGIYDVTFVVTDAINHAATKHFFLTIDSLHPEFNSPLPKQRPAAYGGATIKLTANVKKLHGALVLTPETSITFTAGMKHPGKYEYLFMVNDTYRPEIFGPPYDPENPTRNFSAKNTWVNSGFIPGEYTLAVYARKIGTSGYLAVNYIKFTIIPPPPPTGLKLTSSLASPQESSKHIWFYADTTTGSNYAEFRISVTYPDGSVHLIAPGVGNPPDTFTGKGYEGYCGGMWNTFGLPAGEYVVSVYERSVYNRTTPYELTTSMSYTLTPSSVILPPTDPDKYGKVLYEKGTEASPGDKYYVFGDTFIAKFDAEWNLIWKKAGSGGNPRFDKDGNIVMYAGGFKKIDTNGNLLSSWNAGLTFVLSSVDATFIDADNNVYVAGRKSPGGSTTVHVFKFDANGTMQWDWSASPEYIVEPTGCHNGAYVLIHGLFVDADGKVHLSGSTRNLNEKFVEVTGPFFMTIDSIGNQLSNVSIPSGGGKLFKDGEGNYVTIGTELIAGTNPAMNVTKFDADGAIIWQKYLASNNDLLIRDYIQDSFGNFYLLSSYMPLPGTPKVVTNEFDRVVVTKIDAEGNKVVAFTGGTTPEEWISGSVVSVDDLGNLFVKTSTSIPEASNYNALMKFNAEGKQEWLK